MIRWTVGPEFVPAALAVRIMIWGYLIGFIFTWVRPTIIAIGKPSLGNLAGLVTAAVVLSLSILLIPKYGYIASSGMWILAFIIGNTMLIGGYICHLSHLTAHSNSNCIRKRDDRFGDSNL